MGLFSIVANVLFIFLNASGSTSACEAPAADFHFQGTIFEQTPFQVLGLHVDFFKNSPQRIVFTYNESRKTWCYRAVKGTASWPSHGCLESTQVNGKAALRVDQRPVRRFVLHAGSQAGPGWVEIRLNKKVLSARFYDRKGKSTGKSVVFEVARGGLEISGWNCPNPKYLSCVGALIQSTPAVREAPDEAVGSVSAELSKSLGHYQLSCDGLREVTSQANARPTPAFRPQ